MFVEEKLKDCRYNLKQIIHFNPDPYYVDYFFRMYIQSVSDFYDEIFEEANRDFGLFVSGKCTKEKFEKKAVKKDDVLALRFLSWFKENYEKEHSRTYPKFIKEIICFLNEYHFLPKIIVKMKPDQIYEDDVFQLIKVGLTKGKIKSKEDLEIEIKRQTPVYLELINQKRKKKNDPKLSKNQINVSAYLEMKNYENIEISHACEVYLPVMTRILEKSRDEIKQLVSWTG